LFADHVFEPWNSLAEDLKYVFQTIRMLFLQVLDYVGQIISTLAETLLRAGLGLLSGSLD